MGIILVGLVVTGMIFGVSRWATAPTWVPAFANVPMESVGKMTDKLTEAGIAFRLDKGGSEIQVASADLPKARVTLARENLPSAGRPGMELFDQPSWGMTDFTQRVNYRRALEGELERTIGKMKGIEAAQVHLAIEDASVFKREERPSEASVVIKLQNGSTPAPDVVSGIAHLVASSVDGLKSEKVTVLDETGRMLSLDGEDGSIAGLSSRQLSVQREVEGYLEKKAERLVSQIVGAGNTRVQVAAAINFDKIERTTSAVDPDRQALATEQKAEITPGAQGGAASSNTAASYENTRSTETFSGAIGNVKRLTVAVLVNDRIVAGAKPTVTPRTAAEIARIDTLVRSAVGADSARGDVVSVVNTTFESALPVRAEPVAKPDSWTRVQSVQKPLIAGAALLVLMIVALVAIRSLKPARSATAELRASATATALPPASQQYASLAPLHYEDEQPELAAPAKRRIILPPMPESPIRDQVLATVDQRPEVAVRVIKNWLKD
jgi:flagellar M-ring protein FliF